MASNIHEVDISSLTFETLDKIRGYMKRMIDAKGSDLHIKANAVVRARVNGEILPLSGEILSKDDALIFAKELLRTRFAEFAEKKELDLVYPYDDTTRFRVNIFFQMEGVSAVFRVIPVKILSLEELGLPDIVKKFTLLERGLLLVTGVTGSGKSTTLAAMINEINWKKRKHIVTVEDPIEYYLDGIGQTQVNLKVEMSFARGLRAILKQPTTQAQLIEAHPLIRPLRHYGALVRVSFHPEPQK